MSINAVDIIGALTYRTAAALNTPLRGNVDTEFQKNVGIYKFYKSLFNDKNKMHLWHYPGTQQEIQETWGKINKDQYASLKKFPAILNFQGIDQERGRYPGMTRLIYNLSIVAPVDSNWTTQQRNDTVFEVVLRPIYTEFIRQIKKCGWFQIGFNGIPHNYKEVFTTGANFTGAIRMQYGDYIDAIQLTELKLDAKIEQCVRDSETINKESRQVTDALIDILQTIKNN